MPTKEIAGLIDSHIHLDAGSLRQGILDELTSMLTITNWERIQAEERGDPEYKNMPESWEMFHWDDDGETLSVNRGSADLLNSYFDEHGIEIDYIDDRTTTDSYIVANEIALRLYQVKIVDAVLEAEQGIIKAPTGAGKTVAALEIIRRLGGNALVIVNTKEIAGQWMDRIEQWLGPNYPKSMIGDGKFEISEGITVALQPTLWSRYEQLYEDGFFARFRAVCLDECHHATATTYNFVFNSFTAQVRFGMSATPEKTGNFKLARMVVGPIMCEVTEKDVETQVLKPEIQVIETEFGAVFKGDSMTDRGFRRNNYQSIIKKLVADKRRAQLIIDVLMKRHRDNVNLVLSKQMKHMELLYDLLVDAGYDEDRIFTIIGNDSLKERQAAIKETEEGPCVIFSTLADEALDAPRIDRVFLTWPTKNTKLVEQQIGRARRRHPDKKDAIAIDFRDTQVGPMESQYMQRRHSLYNPKGWTVTKIKREDI